MEDRIRSLSAEDFEPLRQQPFVIQWNGHSIPAQLTEIQRLGGDTTPDAVRRPFSIVLTAAMQGAIPQQILRVENDTLGALDLFLVPLGPDPQRQMRYEAVFT